MDAVTELVKDRPGINCSLVVSNVFNEVDTTNLAVAKKISWVACREGRVDSVYASKLALKVY